MNTVNTITQTQSFIKQSLDLKLLFCRSNYYHQQSLVSLKKILIQKLFWMRKWSLSFLSGIRSRLSFHQWSFGTGGSLVQVLVWAKVINWADSWRGVSIISLMRCPWARQLTPHLLSVVRHVWQKHPVGETCKELVKCGSTGVTQLLKPWLNPTSHLIRKSSSCVVLFLLQQVSKKQYRPLLSTKKNKSVTCFQRFWTSSNWSGVLPFRRFKSLGTRKKSVL